MPDNNRTPPSVVSPPWTFQGNIFSDDDIADNKAFIYIITHIHSGKYYVGRKNFYTPKYYTVNKKRKRRFIISDYATYWGSSTSFNAFVDQEGKENFTREIIHLCESKGISNYLEAKEQFERQVLFDNLSFNSIINCRIHRNHVKSLIKDE